MVGRHANLFLVSSFMRAMKYCLIKLLLGREENFSIINPGEHQMEEIGNFAIRDELVS